MEAVVMARGEEQPQAILYLRCASGRQADRDLAIVAQQHVCAWRAHELGATVAAEFVDYGSGLSTERPALSELLTHVRQLRQAAARQRIYVIAADHARIGRSVQAYSHVSWEIEQAGGRLIIASVPQIEYDALARRAVDTSQDSSPPVAPPDGDNA
jgi:DNA invertase Pin-like site-specific DNA recombinase